MKKEILIIDDDTQNILALTQILTPTYEVFAAKNGKEGVELALEKKPDLILLDIIMPDMDGYVTLINLKNNAATQSVPIIVMSGLNDVIDIERGLYLGAAEYLTKPFSDGLVLLRVKNVLLIEGVKNAR